MSTESSSGTVTQPPGLSYWIPELVAAADQDPFGAGPRLRSLVGSHRARIGLDADTVDVAMRGVHLHVEPPHPTRPVDGFGTTSTEVVLALLDGRLEVSDAIHRGVLTATGSREAITMIFAAIEVLLDASSRVPRFRELAGEFDVATRHRLPAHDGQWLRADDRATPIGEFTLLHRLGLNGRGPS